MVLAGILCISLAAFIPSFKAEAYDEVTSLSITVGYWGGTEYVKNEVSLTDLESALGTRRAVYTWINAGNTPGATEAEGIYLYDLMNYFGIDMNSVYYYNFYTVDGGSYDGAAKQWTYDQLFCPRYSYEDAFYQAIYDYQADPDDYMENPARHYTVNDFFDFASHSYTEDAWNNRKEVEPMLALRLRPSQWNGYIPASYLDFSSLTTTGKPVLLFGQAGTNDITRNLQAQMVYKIHIWFNGSPQITVDPTDLSGEIGASQGVMVQVSTPDSFLSQKVLEDLQYISSDDSIAQVDSNGTVTFRKEGNATITVMYAGQVVGTVGASGIGNGDDDTSPDGGGSGDGSGSSDGSGSGSGSGSGKNSGTGTGTGSRNAQGSGASATSRRSAASTSKNASKASAASAQDGSGQKGSAGGSASGGGGSNGPVYEISPAMEQLMESPVTNRLLRWVLLVVGLALLTGAVVQAVNYNSEVSWVNRAKKVYERI